MTSSDSMRAGVFSPYPRVEEVGGGEQMNGKERVVAALNHKSTDRIPIDFGGTATTGVHVSCVAAMRDYYGLEKRLVKVHEPYQMLGWIDDDLKEAMGVDVEGAIPRDTIFGFPMRTGRVGEHKRESKS